LAAAQELYEAKLATYPRSDCPYLPVEMHADAARSIGALGGAEIPGIDPQRRHAAWNTTKVEAHHGIIPTGRGLSGVSGLSEDARTVYELLRESFLRLFMPPEAFETREALFTFPGGQRFKASARIVQEPGWTQLGQGDSGAEDGEAGQPAKLPILTEGQQLTCQSAQVLAKRTAPPKPYTDGTLIAAMTGVHKLVTDPKLKARLKETSGLGTEATRASMIEVLISREYAERKKKEIHPTERGAQLIDMLRKVTPDLADPGMTALQEDALAAVASARLGFDAFMVAQIDTMRDATSKLLGGQLGAKPATLNPCPACGSSRCAKLSSKAGNAYHRCMECEAAFADDAGKPGKRFEDKPQGDAAAPKQAGTGPKCPSCKKPTFKNETKTGKAYYRCGGCKGAWWPDRKDEGKLGGKWEDRV
jgi:DNA topoisomerase-3